MKIWLMGAEQPTNLRLTGDYPHVGMSYASLRKRLPKTKAWSFKDRFPGKEVYLALGGAAVRKMSDSEFATYEQEAVDFVGQHAADLTLVSGIDDPRIVYEDVNDVEFAPVWFPDLGVRALETLAASYRTVALRGDDIRTSPSLAAQLLPLRNRFGVFWHLLDGARMDDLMTGKYQSAATIAWLSPMRNGETIVWDGVRMQRYPERMKDVARPRHKSVALKAEVDGDKFVAGDYGALTEVAVWSFAQMEAFVDRKKPSSNPFQIVQDNLADHIEGLINTEDEEQEWIPPGTDLDVVDNSHLAVRNEPNTPVKRSGPREVMPGFNFEVQQAVEFDDDGNQIIVERLLAKKGSQPLRQCDTCHVQSNCPAFKPQAECAYSLPIEIKTKEQLSAALAAFLEKQMDRVAFMLMQEDLNGGYADPNTSQEMDRLFEMIKKMKDIEDNREFIKFQVEARGKSGVMSRLFGEQAKGLGNLDAPIPGAEFERRIIEP